jgi:hypothetical protein
MVTRPAASTVATAGSELLYITAKPLLAVAVNMNGLSPTVFDARAAKVMVCAAGDTVSVFSSDVTEFRLLVTTTLNFAPLSTIAVAGVT